MPAHEVSEQFFQYKYCDSLVIPRNDPLYLLFIAIFVINHIAQACTAVIAVDQLYLIR